MALTTPVTPRDTHAPRTERRTVKINARLRNHPDPCVIWVFWRVDPATCQVSVQYRYSPSKSWPSPAAGEVNFILKWGDFLPGFLDIERLVSLLF